MARKLKLNKKGEFQFIVEADGTLRLFNRMSDYWNAVTGGYQRGIKSCGWGEFTGSRKKGYRFDYLIRPSWEEYQRGAARAVE